MQNNEYYPGFKNIAMFSVLHYYQIFILVIALTQIPAYLL